MNPGILKSAWRLVMAFIFTFSLSFHVPVHASPLEPVISANGAGGTTFVVTNGGDDGFGTLRYYIEQANAILGPDTIYFYADYTITLASSLPVITETLTIDGSAPGNYPRKIVIDGANAYRVFDVPSGVTLTLDELTILNGDASGSGGGAVRVDAGTLVLTRTTFSENEADDGGAIYSMNSTLTISNSTFSGNQASFGGGIFIYGGSTAIINSTFSANGASVNGGGILHSAGSLTLQNVILANSTSGSDCYSSVALVSDVNNLIESHTGCGSPVSTADPLLSPLGDHKGYTLTFDLLAGSPAMDAGDNTACATSPVSNMDQRSAPRPFDGDENGSAICDIGSVEKILSKTFQVTTVSSDGPGSLYQAVMDANANRPIEDTIQFQISGNIPVTPMTITDDLIIDGTGQVVNLDGWDSRQIFYVLRGPVVTLNRLTISRGTGSAITNLGTLTVTNCTFIGNSRTDNGAAIFNLSKLLVANTTFSGNSAMYKGGAIYSSYGDVTVMNSTFSNNSADDAGTGIYNEGGVLELKNTILANSGGYGVYDCYSTLPLVSDVNNLIESHSGCGSPVSTSDPLLGPLGDNGGPTQTFALLPGSPALNAGDNSTCAAPPVNNWDQRGVTRPFGASCDIGSFEKNNGRLTTRSAGAQDGWILESGENSGIGGTMNSTATTLRLGDDTARRQYRSILSFATGATLPDNAIITKVTLKVKKELIIGGGNPVTAFQGFMLDVRKGTFGTLNLQLTDWQASTPKTIGPFTPGLTSGWYVMDMTSAMGSINKLATGGGLTQIRLRFKLDDNNNPVANYLSLYSGNAPLASRPTLIVEYYVP